MLVGSRKIDNSWNPSRLLWRIKIDTTNQLNRSAIAINYQYDEIGIIFTTLLCYISDK